MPNDNEFRNLPQYLRDRPDVRALRLRAYRVDATTFQVPGRQKVYRVTIHDDEIRCECQAALHGLVCAHALCVALELGKSQQSKQENHPMSTQSDVDVLDGAVRQNSNTRKPGKKTILHVGIGAHAGYWLGFGEKVVEDTGFPCKKCKGSGKFELKNGDLVDHRICNGTGKEIKTKISMRYQLGASLIEEEWLNYSISPAGTTGDGQPRAASDLFKRLRGISRIEDPRDAEYTWEQALLDWYKSLPRPIKIPINVMVGEKDNGDGVIITGVSFKPTKDMPTPPALPPKPVKEHAQPQNDAPYESFDDGGADEMPF